MENKAPQYPTLLDRALEFAVQQHAGQYRHDGITPFVFHPIDVAKGLMAKGIGKQVVLAAAACHDIIEDTGCSYDGLASELGTEVADLVMQVTKIGIDDSTIEKKMEFIKAIKDKSTDALLIKIQDRLCNVNDYCIGDKRKWYAGYYAMQAYPFYNELLKRKDNIVDEFGADTYQAFLDAMLGLSQMVSDQYGGEGYHDDEKLLMQRILNRDKGKYGKKEN